jgi:chemotaxis methyl-accepting protein methylase
VDSLELVRDRATARTEPIVDVSHPLAKVTHEAEAFDRCGDLYCVRTALGRAVEFRSNDIRSWKPDREFDLILCRNLALTYFAPVLQRAVMTRITAALRTGGALVVGSHESLLDARELVPWPGVRCVYRRQPPKLQPAPGDAIGRAHAES